MDTAFFPRVQGDAPRRGRRAAADPRQRRRHVRCAYYRLVLNRSPRWIAGKFRCSLRTVQLWVKAALSYATPEAQALRDLLGVA